jgi:hypothetical protein
MRLKLHFGRAKCRSSPQPAIHHKSQQRKMGMLKNWCMKRANAQYWACQIAGWGAYSALGMWAAVLHRGWRPSVIVGYLLFFLYSIGLTHLLRREIRRRQWTSLPVHRALPRLAAASVVIGAVESALVVGVPSAIEGRLGVWGQASSVAYLFMGLCVVTASWTILYLTITTLRHSREARHNEMRMKLALSNAELRALEAQLDPHFFSTA